MNVALSRRGAWVLRSFFAVVVVFLYAPIAILVLFSFNDSKRNFAWRGFTLDWYPRLFANEDLLDALGRTLQVAALAVIGSVILGMLLGLGITRPHAAGGRAA
jgi:spermidine/putrescine transport system permease protein